MKSQTLIKSKKPNSETYKEVLDIIAKDFRFGVPIVPDSSGKKVIIKEGQWTNT